MFLKILQERAGRVRRNESGYALLAAIAAVAVTLTIALTVTTSTVSSLGFSTSTRASAQSRSAADAGINYWLSVLNAGNYLCSQGAFGSGYAGPTYSTTISYKNSGGSALSCPAGSTVTGTPATATVISTGYATSRGSAGNGSGNSARIQAQYSITPAVAATSAVNLTSTVFDGSALSLVNGASLHESSPGAQDANVYANGKFDCSAGNDTVQGSVWATGDITPTNSCSVTGDLWSGQNITTQGGKVGGNIYMAGTGVLSWSNSGSSVGGSIITNGSVVLDLGGSNIACATQSAAVCGSIVALGSGGVQLKNATKVGGSVLTSGDIYLQNSPVNQIYSNAVSANGNVTYQNGSNPRVGGYIKVKGTIGASGFAFDTANTCQFSGTSNGYTTCPVTPTYPALVPATSLPTNVGWPTTATVNVPPAQQLPTAGSSADDVSLWTNAGYTAVTKSCNDARTYLNNQTYGTTKTLLIVTGCTDPLKWNDVPLPAGATYANSTQKNTLTTSADLAIINPSGFMFGDNGNAIKSSTSTYHELALIVPTGSTGNIYTNSTVMTNIYTFIFTPNTVDMHNALTGFYGQIYAGKVSGPQSGSVMTMHKMNVPGIKDASGAGATPGNPASASILTRYLMSP